MHASTGGGGGWILQTLPCPFDNEKRSSQAWPYSRSIWQKLVRTIRHASLRLLAVFSVKYDAFLETPRRAFVPCQTNRKTSGAAESPRMPDAIYDPSPLVSKQRHLCSPHRVAGSSSNEKNTFVVLKCVIKPAPDEGYRFG